MFERIEFGTRRQAFGIADHLDRQCADAVAARDGFFERLSFEQRANDAGGKTIARADRIDDVRDRLRRNDACIVRRAEIRALRAELDDHAARALAQIEARDVVRFRVAGEDLAFADAGQHPVGMRGERVQRGGHRFASMPSCASVSRTYWPNESRPARLIQPTLNPRRDRPIATFRSAPAMRFVNWKTSASAPVSAATNIAIASPYVMTSSVGFIVSPSGTARWGVRLGLHRRAAPRVAGPLPGPSPSAGRAEPRRVPGGEPRPLNRSAGAYARPR